MLPITVPLWASVRRLNQLFHAYDFQLDAWLLPGASLASALKRINHPRHHRDDTGTTSSSPMPLLVLRTCAIVAIVLQGIFLGGVEGSRSYFEIPCGAFVRKAANLAFWLAWMEGFVSALAYWSLSLAKAITHSKLDAWSQKASNGYWLFILCVHWIPPASAMSAMIATLMAVLTVQGALPRTLLLLAWPLLDLLALYKHRFYATDLLPLLFIYTLTPYSAICWHVIGMLGEGEHLEGLKGMALYWIVTLLGIASSFVLCIFCGK